MDKIHKFIECLVPVTACNLKCEYCYIIYQNRRKGEIGPFNYSPERIGQALNKERLGGIAYISMCGAGETLLPKEMPKIIEEVLKQGHYVNITTNGTISQRFDEIIKLPKELLERLHFAFSFHYLELLKTNNLDIFFNNVKKVREAGSSFLIQLNLYDNYVPHLEEIKKICYEKVGAYPQLAATRSEYLDRKKTKYKLYTQKDEKEYKEIGDSFDSKLFDFTIKNFNVKRKEFCYAGDWSFLLNLGTGNISKCYLEPIIQNIFENVNEPIKFGAIGNFCRYEYCVNSSHFMSLGIIPSVDTPSYAELRNRSEASWYTEKMEAFLSTKLTDTNKEYCVLKKINTNVNRSISILLRKGNNKIKNVKKQFKNKKFNQ